MIKGYKIKIYPTKEQQELYIKVLVVVDLFIIGVLILSKSIMTKIKKH